MRKNNLHKLGLILPVAILFSIITLSNGGFGNGVYGNLYLQPTTPTFSSGSLGSFYFASIPTHFAPTYMNYNSRPSFVGFSYNGYAPQPLQYQSYPSLSRFETKSYMLPVQPVYTTPTSALFDVNYAYSNAGRLW